MGEELVIRFFTALDVDDDLKVLAGLHRAVSGLRYDIIRRAPTADGVLQQHVLRGTLPNGTEVELHAPCTSRSWTGAQPDRGFPGFL